MSLKRSGVILIAEGAGAFFSDMEKAGDAVNRFGATAEGAGKGIGAFGTIATGALHQVGSVAVDVMGKAASAFGSFVAGSVTAAGDFESNMAVFGSVAGDALGESGKSLDEFKQLFISLGTELPVSTAEVQQAAIELAKGGIDPATIAAGGLRTALDLAAAGGVGLADSATIMAKQLGVWVDGSADAATKAAFLAQTADLLSQSANATTSDVSDLAMGLANAGGSAKVAGLSFQETVTGLSMLAPGFSSASDAGTSFKTLIARLIPTTKPATEAMIGLGLATEDGKSKFYDAQGSFIGLKSAAELLHTATAGLSEEQKSLAFNTIFGQDAIRAAAILSEQGAAGYDRMTASLAAAGSVQEQAKARQVGFNTALDNAKGSLEALQLTIGSALLPVLTTLLNDHIAPGINTLTTFAGVVLGTNDNVASLSPTMQTLAAIFGGFFTFFSEGKLDQLYSGLTTVFGPTIAGYIVDFSAKVREIALAFGEGGLSGAISAALPIFGTFGETLKTAFAQFQGGDTGGGISTIVTGLVDTIIAAAPSIIDAVGTWGMAFLGWAAEAAPQAAAQIGTIGATVIAKVGEALPGIIEKVGTWALAFGTWALEATPGMLASLGAMLGQLLDAIGTAAPGIIEKTAEWALAFGTWALNAAPGMLASLTTLASQLWGWISERVPIIGAQLGEWAVAFAKWVPGAAVDLVVKLGELAGQLFGWIVGQMPTINAKLAEWGASFGKWVLDKGIPALLEGLAAAWAKLSGWISETAGKISADGSVGRAIADGIRAGINGAWEGLKGLVAQKANELLTTAKSSLGISSPSAAAAAEVGAPFSQGIAVGITAAAPDAFAAAEAAATGTITAAQGIMETAGPDIGAPLATGLAEGVADAAPAAGSSIQKTLLSIIKAAQSALKISGDESQEAATKVGEPFAEGVASGIADAAPAIERAADAFGKVGLESIPASFAPALDASTDEVAGFVPQFGTAGKNLIGGMKGGVEAAAGALAKAAAAAAKAALDAAKSELGIASPSAVAEEEVGSPFVAGIVAGIANSLDTVKAMARHLSKQLTEDMKKVAEEAANAFKAVLQAELEADAGFAGTRLDIFRAMRDLGKGSELADAKAGIGEAEEKLKDARDKQLDIDKDYNEKTKDLNDDFNKIEKERVDALAKVRAKRGGDSGAAEAEIDTKRDSDIAMIDADTRLTRDVRDKLIADVRAQAEAEKAAARARAAALQTDAGYQQEIADINAKYDEKLGEINDKLFEARDAYDEQSSALATQLIQLQAALDLARARVLVEQELDERRRDMVGATQRQLDQAATEADQIRAFDPAAADAYYQLRSKQILDLAKLEQDSLEALRAYRLSGSVEDRDALGSIDTEKTLLAAQQAAERALFAANTKANSPYAGLTNEITALQQKLTAELQRDQGFYNLTDKNNLKMREKIAKEIAADQNAIAQINALLEQVGAAAMGGGVAGIEGGAPGLIAAMQAAFEEAKRATEAQLGISSPSKVFALDVGLPVAQGIAQGISKGQGAIEDALAMSVSPPNLGAQTVRPAMTAQQQATSYQYNQQSYGSIGTFNAQAGVTRGDVQAMIMQAFDRSGRTAYTRRATA